MGFTSSYNSASTIIYCGMLVWLEIVNYPSHAIVRCDFAVVRTV
jgi:hypothetical protein